MHDIFPYGVKATVSRGATSTSTKPAPTQSIFEPNSQMPLKKVLSFKRVEDFYVDVKFSNADRLPPTKSDFIGAYNVSGVAKAVAKNETEKPKVTITFELDRSGMLKITKAEAMVDTYKEEQFEVKKNKTEAKANATDADANATEADADAEAADADADAEKANATEVEEEKVYETKLVKQTHRIKLSTNYTEVEGLTMSKADKAVAKRKLKAIQKTMDEIREMAKSKNDVEAHIFETREKMEYNDALKSVMTEEEKEGITKILAEARCPYTIGPPLLFVCVHAGAEPLRNCRARRTGPAAVSSLLCGIGSAL